MYEEKKYYKWESMPKSWEALGRRSFLFWYRQSRAIDLLSGWQGMVKKKNLKKIKKSKKY
jgi:hypothetical protein